MSFVFCKQKTAYEVRISDWSSDVGSSDLDNMQGRYEAAAQRAERYRTMHQTAGDAVSHIISDRMMMQSSHLLGNQAAAHRYAEGLLQIGSAAVRARVCQYV